MREHGINLAKLHCDLAPSTVDIVQVFADPPLLPPGCAFAAAVVTFAVTDEFRGISRPIIDPSTGISTYETDENGRFTVYAPVLDTSGNPTVLTLDEDEQSAEPYVPVSDPFTYVVDSDRAAVLIDVVPGALRVRRQDLSGASLAGACFAITGPNSYSETLCDDEMNRDADLTAGNVLLTALLPGDYNVTETTSPSGYTPITAPQTVTVPANDVGEAMFASGSIASGTELVDPAITWQELDGTWTLSGDLVLPDSELAGEAYYSGIDFSGASWTIAGTFRMGEASTAEIGVRDTQEGYLSYGYYFEVDTPRDAQPTGTVLYVCGPCLCDSHPTNGALTPGLDIAFEMTLDYTSQTLTVTVSQGSSSYTLTVVDQVDPTLVLLATIGGSRNVGYSNSFSYIVDVDSYVVEVAN